MNELLDKEIEELFEQLIVAKVKKQIDELDRKIEDIKEYDENMENSLDKLAKQSHIAKAKQDDIEKILREEDDKFSDVKENITKIIKSIGKQITNINNYLEQECQISSGEKLGEYIEENWNIVKLKIENCLETEHNCLESSIEISHILAELKDGLKENKAEIISSIDERRDKICVQNDEIKKCQKELKNDLDEIDRKWTEGEKKIIEKLEALKELQSLMQNADRIIEGQKEGSTERRELKENILENENKIKELQTNVTDMMPAIRSMDINWKEKYQKLSFTVKMLLIGQGVSILGLGIMICKLFIG